MSLYIIEDVKNWYFCEKIKSMKSKNFEKELFEYLHKILLRRLYTLKKILETKNISSDDEKLLTVIRTNTVAAYGGSSDSFVNKRHLLSVIDEKDLEENPKILKIYEDIQDIWKQLYDITILPRVIKNYIKREEYYKHNYKAEMLDLNTTLEFYAAKKIQKKFLEKLYHPDNNFVKNILEKTRN